MSEPRHQDLSIGILGIGELAGFLVRGMSRGNSGYDFVLSPRNAEKAAQLANDFPAVVAESNQAVLDQSDVVLVCLPAGSGLEILSNLTFREDQIVISAMARAEPKAVEAAVSPAKACMTMMPGFSNALGEGPCLLYPDLAPAREVLSHLGPVHSFTDADLFFRASMFGGFSGATYFFMKQVITWFIEQGMEEKAARDLVAQTLKGNAQVILEAEEGLDEIIQGIATPGGITHQLRENLNAQNALDAWPEALDKLLREIHKN